MAVRETDIDTTLAPDGVVALLTDFSARRAEIWPLLSPGLFEVLSAGETSAVVREGTAKPFEVWARERYDWSTPGLVTWTVEESNAFAPGFGMEARVSPLPNGGSRVHVRWERVGRTFKGKLVVALVSLAKARPVFQGFERAFERAARG